MSRGPTGRKEPTKFARFQVAEYWRYLPFLLCGLLTVTSLISSLLKFWPNYISDGLGIAAAVVGGVPIVVGGVRALLNRDLDVDLLASIAIVASMLVGEFPAAAVVALMLTGGEILEDYTVRRTSRAIEKLIESVPKVARVRKDGKEVEVPIEKVRMGDIVLVKPGEEISVDGAVVTGQASVNQAPITGESIPVVKKEGSEVFGGTIVELGALEIKVTKVGEDTTLARIIRLIREGQENRAPVEKVANRYAKWFAPGILAIAVLAYLATRSIVVAVSTLVIACPCALTLATPTAIVAGIGNAARRGVLIKGGAILEKVGSVDAVVLDKTGTLTIGKPLVTDVKGFKGRSEVEVISLAAIGEKFSEHPLSKAILSRAEELRISVEDPSDFEAIPGSGIVGHKGNNEIVVGNRKLLESKGIELTGEEEQFLDNQKTLGRTSVFVCENRSVIGVIGIADVPRKGVMDSIATLKDMGIRSVVMLTGDNPVTADAIAKQAGISEAVSELLPEQKVDYVKKLRERGHEVLMVGDGINDAPALATADVGMAMGEIGTDVAIETADIVLMSDDITKVPIAIELGRKTLSTIKQNILFATIVNLVGVLLAVHGDINPIIASAIHEGTALLVVLNSARLIRAR